ncbi:hypothetical protein [Streptomyces sp. NPDC005898]|uniref:hypothetical protein n=1 Tax=Streptomyces sp. NPDC005898 TaxID=3157082 RepID=UPI0033EF9CD2
MKDHAGRVVRYLRDQEARLSREDPDLVVADIADALVTIAEQYSAGQVGALLPEEMIQDLVPPKDWESLQLAAVLVTALAAGIGAHFLGMTAIAPWIGAGVLLLGLIITFRQDFRRFSTVFPNGGFAP